MRISDWSSDVCSSDLVARSYPGIPGFVHAREFTNVGNENLSRQNTRFIGTDLGQQRIDRGQDLLGLAFHVLGRIAGGFPRKIGDAIVNDSVRHALAGVDVFDVAHGETPQIEIRMRSEEHTSELQSLMRTSYAVFCLKKTITQINIIQS